jgi:IS5 family transposase
MLRTRAPGVSLWEAVLPDQVLRLPEELARVDPLLDDPVFFAPFVPLFDRRVGRPSTPMEVYLRMMFLKFRYRLGYDSLCREVGDSITWWRFCRIPLDGRVPHPTTLMTLTTRCGTAAVDGCNEALLAKAGLRRIGGEAAAHGAAAGGHHGRARGRGLPDRLRVVGQCLLAKAVRRIGAAGRRIQAAGGAVRTRLRDRSRSAGTKARAIGAKLRLRAGQTRDQAQTAVRRITGELAGLAERTATEAREAGREAAAQRPPSPARRRSQGRRARRGRALRPGRRAASRQAAPRGRRPDPAAHRHPPDRRPDPATTVRDHSRRRHPPGQPARRRRPPDR